MVADPPAVGPQFVIEHVECYAALPVAVVIIFLLIITVVISLGVEIGEGSAA
jgi:hypothetical protein